MSGTRGREYRSSYILEGDPHRVKGRLMRHVLVTGSDGHQSVAVEVPNDAAMDVLEALRRAYEQGREDNAQAYAEPEAAGQEKPERDQLVAEIIALHPDAYSDLSTVVLLTDMPVLRRALLLAESARYARDRGDTT